MADDNKEDIGFNEALRRIANSPKDLLENLNKPKKGVEAKKKAAPSKEGAAKVNQNNDN